jgi:cob(I)alamin adenosyltransferase
VGSMAATGAQIGMAFPPWGVFIGASIGLIVGVILSVVGLLTSKAAKIRKAQAKVQAHLDGKVNEALASATKAHDKLMAEVRTHVDAHVQRDLMQLRATLAQPGQMVEQQISAMSRILRQVEGMPNGAVQAVRL